MSTRSRIARFLGRLILAGGIALAAYLLVYRPLQLRWGASDQDIERAMPGDEIVQRPTFDATRALTIDATPEQIWPWLVQIGLKRAGWYSYDLIDNLAKPSAERIIPEFQHLQVGDLIPVSPDGKIGFWVKDFEPNRWMLWWDKSGGMTWLWGLYPLDGGRTRLITRIRMSYNWLSPAILFDLALDVGDFVMMRQSMLGIKARAEGQPVESLYGLTVELLLWIVAFIGFVIAEVWIVVRQDWRRPLVVAIAAASTTILLVLWKPPLGVDALFTTGIIAGLRWAFQHKAENKKDD